MRILVVVALCIAGLACREVQPLSVPEPEVSGYVIAGTATTENGVPVEGAVVRLWYAFSPISDAPIDTARPVVTDPTKVVDVWVETPAGAFVRQLLLDYLPPGPVPRIQWDFRDAHGDLVPSGEYRVKTRFDTALVKVERRLADGLPTTVTDAAGRFTIGSDRLPIGVAYDLYTLLNRYGGTYTVLAEVYLDVIKSPLSGATQVVLNQNRLTTVTVTVQ